MKKLLLLALSVLFSLQLFASPSNSLNRLTDETLRFEVEGRKINDNFYSPRRIINIPKVDSKFYLPKAIHIKTKSHLTKNKGASAELTPSIQSATQGLSLSKVRALFPKYSDYSLLSSDKNGIGRIYEITYVNPIDPYDVCRELMNNPDIEYASPVFVYYPFFMPNDPSISKQYYLTKMSAQDAWDISLGNPNVRIAIVDSGVDYTHPDLTANMAEGGYDFVGNVTANDVANNRWKEDSDPKPLNTSNFHGTHVTGCANAVTNNEVGIASIAANCKYIPIKCAADNGNIIGIYRGYEAIIYAAELGADIINCSWGGPGYSPAGEDAINQATDMGSVVVVASGNEGSNIDYEAAYPACYDNVICVGATSSSDKATAFSNYGHSVTVYAPGDGIYSTRNPDTYSSEQGTSMASPIVAGLAALVKSVFPNYTPRQIYHQIRSTSDDVFSVDKRPQFYGRANALKAIKFNNPNFPNDKIPGCDVVEYQIGKNDAFTNYSLQTLRLKVQNFLSATSPNAKVRFTSLDNFLSVKSTQSTLGALSTMDSKDITIDVQITKDNVWFGGYANLLVTFEDNGYLDYKLVKLPIKVNTDNAYTLHNSIPSSTNITLRASSSPNKNTLWAVGDIFGYFGALYRQTETSKALEPIYTGKVECVFAFDAYKAFIGQSASNSATISFTSNGGSSWEDKSVTNITNSVKNIHFFNANEGIFVGNPLNSKWGVAITNDAGNSWQQPTFLSSPQTGEENLPGAIAAYGDNFWFASTQGRVFATKNKGQTWQVTTVNGSKIAGLAFINQDSGLVVYNSANNQKSIARTTDGGQHWANGVFNFATKNVEPISLFALSDKAAFIAVCKNGEIFISFDLGEKWLPVLSKYTPNVTTSAGVISNNYVRVWLSGTTISTLDFPIPLANAQKQLSFIDQSPFDYGEVGVGTSKIERINLKNDGNTKTYIERIYFTGDDANSFQTTVGTASIVEPGTSASARVRFTPSKVGLHTAKMIVESDAEPYTIEIDIKGTGIHQSEPSFTTNGVSEVRFDTTLVASTDQKSLSVVNNGDTPIQLNASIFNGNGAFAIDSPNNLPIALQPNDETTINLSFTPADSGASFAELRLIDDISGYSYNVSLLGYSIYPTSVKESIKNINVYPNPAGDAAYCIVSFSDDDMATVKLLDISGKMVNLVYSGKVYSGDNMIVIPTNQLSKGTYILLIDNGRETISQKLIVQ